MATECTSSMTPELSPVPWPPMRSALRPNPSLEPTRYGRHCKPGLSHSNYRLSPGLQYLPTRAAQLER